MLIDDFNYCIQITTWGVRKRLKYMVGRVFILFIDLYFSSIIKKYIKNSTSTFKSLLHAPTRTKN